MYLYLNIKINNLFNSNYTKKLHYSKLRKPNNILIYPSTPLFQTK